MNQAVPTVTVVIPVLDEELHLAACLAAVQAQTYPSIVEILVVDGGSSDRTVEIAASSGATVLRNPRRIQAAGLNIALAQARGEVFVRVDGHCRIAADYVQRSVDALCRTGAALVGGAMTPIANSFRQRGIAVAMTSAFGAGPARFHLGGEAGWVETVYLGCCRTSDARAVGGYAEDVGVNEDAEFALRIDRLGGVWFDPAIRSTYVPRTSLRAVGRQFFRYGRSRAATVRRHPRSVRWRQLSPPLLVFGIASPRRRGVLTAYLGVLGVAVVLDGRRAGWATPVYAAVLPVMHVTWGVGFLAGLVVGPPRSGR